MVRQLLILNNSGNDKLKLNPKQKTYKIVKINQLFSHRLTTQWKIVANIYWKK